MMLAMPAHGPPPAQGQGPHFRGPPFQGASTQGAPAQGPPFQRPVGSGPPFNPVAGPSNGVAMGPSSGMPNGQSFFPNSRNRGPGGGGTRSGNHRRRRGHANSNPNPNPNPNPNTTTNVNRSQATAPKYNQSTTNPASYATGDSDFQPKLPSDTAPAFRFVEKRPRRSKGGRDRGPGPANSSSSPAVSSGPQNSHRSHTSAPAPGNHAAHTQGNHNNHAQHSQSNRQENVAPAKPIRILLPPPKQPVQPAEAPASSAALDISRAEELIHVEKACEVEAQAFCQSVPEVAPLPEGPEYHEKQSQDQAQEQKLEPRPEQGQEQSQQQSEEHNHQKYQQQGQEQIQEQMQEQPPTDPEPQKPEFTSRRFPGLVFPTQDDQINPKKEMTMEEAIYKVSIRELLDNSDVIEPLPRHKHRFTKTSLLAPTTPASQLPDTTCFSSPLTITKTPNDPNNVAGTRHEQTPVERFLKIADVTSRYMTDRLDEIAYNPHISRRLKADFEVLDDAYNALPYDQSLNPYRVIHNSLTSLKRSLERRNHDAKVLGALKHMTQTYDMVRTQALHGRWLRGGPPPDTAMMRERFQMGCMAVARSGENLVDTLKWNIRGGDMHVRLFSADAAGNPII
ncbi:hypothetical protein Dda_2415 [Drechslerella dactyloides]|uniref:Uncharacterized protein n=1 Tax=Drechslerella dactyloides TaxID=74499 RepID=A0AAD6NNW2_DREDA|nr:hypothetical protein Dda_2415 [Drechslerella dactyloides]